MRLLLAVLMVLAFPACAPARGLAIELTPVPVFIYY